MTSKDYIGVSLRVWHREKSPKEISAALGRDPSYAATLGSPRGHPHRAVTAATWQEHYWCSDFDEGATLEERIAAVAKFIQRKRLAMTELMRAGKGGRADLYVFAAPSTALGIELEPVLLADLGQIGINLSVEFMPPSSSGTDEDMKQIDTINENYFGGDASGSMVIRALVRTAFKNYPERK